VKARFLWRAFKTRYRDQVAELREIRHAIRLDDTVCDIGANKGSYIYWLSRWAPQGQVVAFEPQERLATYLQNACMALNFKNVRVEGKAVYSKSGTLDFYVPGGGEISPGASLSTRISAREQCRTVSVPVVALDEYFSKDTRVGIIKVDVEGAEKEVFKGATRILKEQSPLLVFECESRHLDSGTVFDVFRFLQDLGYEGQFVCGKALRSIAEFDPATHQKQTGDRFWDAPDYYNNFVFKKRR